jgi:hypothetical protein
MNSIHSDKENFERARDSKPSLPQAATQQDRKRRKDKSKQKQLSEESVFAFSR